MSEHEKSRVMIITHGLYPVPGYTVSGNGVRAWSLAVALADNNFDVIYSTPLDTVHPHTPRVEVTLAPFSDKNSLHGIIETHNPDVLIVGYWAYIHLIPLNVNVPIVMDLLAPWMLEASFQENGGMSFDPVDYLNALGRGDYFMCCTWRQKAFHTAWLFLSGVQGSHFPIDIVPISTLPDLPVRPDNRHISASDDTINRHISKPDIIKFIYGGVVWPWRSPQEWISQMLDILNRDKNGELKLITGNYPLAANADSEKIRLFNGNEYDDVLIQLDLLPYEEMEKVFLEADVGIELGSRNCERELSFSFRLIEYLRCGLPVICNDFLEVSDLVRKYDAGWVLDSSDPSAFEEVLKRILSGQEDILLKRKNAIALVQEKFNIFETVKPLVNFCRNPVKSEKNSMLNGLFPGSMTDSMTESDFSVEGKEGGGFIETCLFKAAGKNLKLNLFQLSDSLPVQPLPDLLKNEQEPFDYQQRAIDRFLEYADVSGKTVLEIGADDAVVMRKLSEKGMSLGLGVNNWYWHDKEHKTVKVADNIILSWGDIRSVPLEDESFDLIIAIAAFEHVRELDQALREMHRLLKPGGIIYSYYGPIWSCGVGHHLWFEREGVYYRFSELESTLPILENYEHLLMDREEMSIKLRKKWDQDAVDDFIYQIYDNDHINRYMYSDYAKLFNNSDFKVVAFEKADGMEIDPEVQRQLTLKYGPENDFTCGNLEVVLEKEIVSKKDAASEQDTPRSATVPHEFESSLSVCENSSSTIESSLPVSENTPSQSESNSPGTENLLSAQESLTSSQILDKISRGSRLLYRALVKRMLMPLISRRGKKNLAIITREDLFPVEHGAAAKIYHTARALSFEYDEVYLVTLDREKFYVFSNGEFHEELYPRLFRTLFYPTEEMMRKKIKAVGIPDDEAFLFFPLFDDNFKLRVLYVALQKSIEVYQAEFPFFMDACSWAHKIFGGKRSIVEHNVEFQRIFDNHRTSDAVKEWIKAYEVRLCNMVDHVVTVSHNDTHDLVKAGVSKDKITMIPHGVDIENFNKASWKSGLSRDSIRNRFGIFQDDVVLIFHGIFCYGPNSEAAQLIGSQILPELNRRGYAPKCLAVGKYPPDKSNHPDLIYTGVVEHVAPYLLAADIAVVPLQDGGGTRMKILEYFAAGLPVVATPKGAEGICVTPGKEIIIEPDMTLFVDALVELIQNSEKRFKTGEAGRLFVQQMDWMKIGKHYANLYDNIHEASTNPSASSQITPSGVSPESSSDYSPITPSGASSPTVASTSLSLASVLSPRASSPTVSSIGSEYREPVEMDYTKGYEYERLIEEEKAHYSEIEVTERLTEGGRHAHSAWEYYWQRVGSHIQQNAGEYADVTGYLEKIVPQERPIRILSLGSGYCGQELMLARQFSKEYEITCVDINEALFEKARKVAVEENLNIVFKSGDLNFLTIEKSSYDMIYAHAVLHHVINLEILYDQIASGLTSQGFFHLVEVVGENRRLLWEENEKFVNSLLAVCPDEFISGHKVKPDEEEEGMEGVRQEEILSLLKSRFTPDYEYLHGAFMRFVCLHEVIGKSLEPASEDARKYLDFLIECDESCVGKKMLRPLEVWGIYRPISV
ncbi:hypothetical protein MTBBW1_2030054 [Desulfamplus magnetovallimortis]|uniref:Methyltransferase type 11 domain-containing protein n=1 Tax=Desulfamplus magnetovallimortis TaxID=1246637 RepID=A0A1W1HBU6_9BACT|nr:methyltransferase domain-containing protein [Desulfamplus magnetovallimortis]SLM29964.1 hypothetical protein MTBBW1_2030054 [Desulfamplus magnetovallimortis]